MSAYEDAIKAGGVPVDAPLTPYEQALKQGGVPYDPGILDRAGEVAVDLWKKATAAVDKVTAMPKADIPVDNIRPPTGLDMQPPPGMPPEQQNFDMFTLDSLQSKGKPIDAHLRQMEARGWKIAQGASTAAPPSLIPEPDAFGMVPLDDPLAALTGAGASAVDLSKGIVQGLAAGGAAALAAPAAIISGKPELIPEAYREVAGAAPLDPVWKAVLPNKAETYREQLGAVISAPTIAGDVAGEKVFEKTGSPTLAALAATGIEGSPLFAGMGLFGKVPKFLTDSTWYRKMTIPERGVVLSTVEQLKASGMTEGEIARLRPEYWKEAFKKRGGSVEETPPMTPAPEPGPTNHPAPAGAEAPASPISRGIDKAAGIEPPAPVVVPTVPPIRAVVPEPPAPAPVADRRATPRPGRSAYQESQVPDLQTVDSDIAAVEANLESLAQDYKAKEAVPGTEGTMAKLEITDRMNKWNDSLDALKKRRDEILEGTPPAPVEMKVPEAKAKPATAEAFEKARAEREPLPRTGEAVAAPEAAPEVAPAPDPMAEYAISAEDMADIEKGDRESRQKQPAVTWKKAAIVPTRAGVKAIPLNEDETPIAQKPPEEVTSPAPTRPFSDRWTADRGAIPGEPSHFLDGETADTAKGALIERVSEQGTSSWDGYIMVDGKPLPVADRLGYEAAARKVEMRVDKEAKAKGPAKIDEARDAAYWKKAPIDEVRDAAKNFYQLDVPEGASDAQIRQMLVDADRADKAGSAEKPSPVADLWLAWEAGRNAKGQPGTPPFPDDIMAAHSAGMTGKPWSAVDTSKAVSAEETALTPQKQAAADVIADRVAHRLTSGDDGFDSKQLFAWADDAHGGTQAQGKYSPKDAYDAMELGVNKILAGKRVSWMKDYQMDPTVGAIQARDNIASLKKLTSLLPTQTKRTEEMTAFQQYSTPPALSYAANWVANLRKGDVYLEPSAGIGGLAAFGKRAGATVVVNELSPRRAEILKELGFEKVFQENAEQLNNILPKNVAPSVVVMNPPFSATAGRMGDKMVTETGAVHVEQALKRLAPGGRLVAIVGRGMAPGAPTFRDWWKKISSEYTVKANIGVSGKEYTKYGTSFDNRVLVIDKIGAGTVKAGGPVTGDVDKVEDLVGLLNGVRNDRPTVEAGAVAAKPELAKSPVQERPRPVESGGGSDLPVQHPVSESRPGAGVVPADGAGTRADHPRDVGLESGKRAEVPGRKQRGGSDRTGTEAANEPGGPRGGDLERSGGQVEPAVGVNVPDTMEGVSVAGLDVTSKAEELSKEEFSDSIFETYRPQKALVKGSKPHPGKLVESAAMSIVAPPDPTYQPKLPREIIDTGKVSEAQLEPVIYAGQSHSEYLPGAVMKDGKEVKYRKGYFVGDGTGVGKGRIIAATLLDNWNQGRKKAVWVSQNGPLINDAKRDVKGIGWDPNLIFDFSKVKLGTPIKATEGILFGGYDLIKSKDKKNIAGEKKGSRLDQIVEWLGEGFDGVIVFDEAHNMGNAIAEKGKMGMKKPSEKALASIELANRLPEARVLYVSATGATEVMNLAYADRLGLWGEGTPFGNKKDFIENITAGGIAAMEMVARDMKAMGNYLARSLSYDDVSYEKLEHTLTPEQKFAYDEMAKAWQIVLKNVHMALKLTSGNRKGKPAGKAKMNAMSAFWGSHQRFFNQIITSLQTPSVISAIENDLKSGKAAVIQLVNTNAAAQDRALSRIEEGDEIEDLDMTPREQLMEYIRNSFPTQQYQEVMDDNGNATQVPVVDSKGNPVENADAIALREELLDKLGGIKVPEGPLEMVLNHFGTEKVAEVTGRQQRVVKVRDEKGEHKAVERWSQSRAIADAEAFANDKKGILVFSYAGGTGRSYHADLGIKNQRLRRHYLLQAGWRADRAIQGFGRTHRSSQKQAPEYILVTTDLKGQKRFISSIARRLDQLGALTRGQRQTGGQGFFETRDNLESIYATRAFRNLVEDLAHRQIPDMSLREFEDETGLKLTDNKGSLISNMPEVPTFLNRLLSMTYDMQSKVFDLFSERMDKHVARAIEDGTLDQGLETLRAKKIDKVKEQVVYTDKTGAETKYLELEVTNDVRLLPFKEVKPKGGFVQNIKSGRVYGKSAMRQVTDEYSNVEEVYDLTAVDYGRHRALKEEADDPKKYKSLTPDEAKDLWNKEIDEHPKETRHREQMISGTLLPIWDRLIGHPRIMRVQTSAGERYIGRILNPGDVAETLRNLGATQSAVKMTGKETLDAVLKMNYTVELANGWKIKRSKVAGENRVELVGPNYSFFDELKRKGAFIERIQYNTRIFLPTGENGPASIEAITGTNRPIISSTPPTSSRVAGLLSDEAGFLAVGDIAALGRELVDAYRRPPHMTESKKIIGKYTGALQEIDQKLTKLAKEYNEKIPKDRQIAITNYLQAGGDLGILKARASKSKAPYDQGYMDATNLSPEEVAFAKAFRQRYDEIWDLAHEAGILEAYVENYVRGEWIRDSKKGRAFFAQVNAGVLNTRPREAMKKIFDSYFEGEQQGLTPKDKRIGYQVVAAERSIRFAIEARKAMAALMTSKETDGRPTVVVGGSGSYLKGATAADERAPFMVRPNIPPKGADTRGYRYLDHPALRKWKWIGKDTEGASILLQGDMWIHPEAFGRINALLGKSKIQTYTVPERVPVIGGTRPGAAMLKAGAFIKGTILLGPFHQFHVGEHAAFHKVNPFNPPEIDFDKRPILREGVEHGLMIFNHNALYEFGEGLATGGLFHKLPIVGDGLRAYQEWLFQDYIPRLKAAMFEHAVKRAEKYYEKELASGKFTRDQLLENAAKQANAAFGEQNYKYIGRNPTVQDALRIVLLAPDFLEARLKFAGQAARPYGKEQLYALLRAALIMGATAQIINTLIGDEKRPHWDRPFSIIIGGREYTPRSVIGDIAHLLSDARSFWYHRLNPLWGRPTLELATGRTFYGKKVNHEDAAKDILKSWIPIPAQGLVKENAGDTFVASVINSVLQSVGMSNYPYKSDAARLVMEYSPRVDREMDRKQKETLHLKNKTVDMLRKGKTWSELPDDMKEKLGALSDQKLEAIDREASMTMLTSRFKRLTVDQKIKVWKVATPEERKEIEEAYNAALDKYAEGLDGEDLEDFKKKVASAE